MGGGGGGEALLFMFIVLCLSIQLSVYLQVIYLELETVETAFVTEPQPSLYVAGSCCIQELLQGRNMALLNTCLPLFER